MRLCGREFDAPTIAKVQEIVAADPSMSRRTVSRRVCESLGWRAQNGKLKEVSCRKALLELERRKLIRLPAPRSSCFEPRRSEGKAEPPLESLEVRCRLEELGEIRIVAITSRYSQASKAWNRLMTQHHYLGKGPLCGAQIRYLVESSRYGWVAALAFSAGQWRLKKRDEYIGWTEGARRANLERVVCNSRFLIRPGVEVANLASHVLSRCLGRLAEDWTQRYGYAPALVESFVDPSRFAGTCYQAANWERVGQTAGRTTPQRNGKVTEGRKDIYVYPLCRDWKAVLCREPDVALRRRARCEAADWVEEEFGAVEFFDDRLKRRLCVLASDFFAQPRELIPQACEGSVAKAKAAYRFLGNPNVNLQTVLKPHVESTIERLRGHRVILAVQDTTTLNYGEHPPEGAGAINNSAHSARGLLVHDTVAFTPEGTPLGLLNVQCWTRDPEQVGQRDRNRLPIEEKESLKWLTSYRAVAEVQKLCPETMLVSVGDREGDVYDLFYEGTRSPADPRLLVRADRTRKRRTEPDGERQLLWERMSAEPVAGGLKVRVPRRGSRLARTAKLEVRFAAVELVPPRDSSFPALRVWAVYAREIDHGVEVKEPIDWLLLTTVATATFEEALRMLTWYSRRWGIEVFHRVLKSGCRIEDRRLEDIESVESCLAIDMVVAWRVQWMTMIGREQPDTPSDQILHEEEWQVLCVWATRQIPDQPPTAGEAMRWIGRMGGWLCRGKNDHPGTTCLWRGLGRLPAMADGFLMAQLYYGVKPGPRAP